MCRCQSQTSTSKSCQLCLHLRTFLPLSPKGMDFKTQQTFTSTRGGDSRALRKECKGSLELG